MRAHDRREYATGDKLIAEDEPVLNTMRFRKGVLVASDRHLARYFEYVSEFPRGQPPSDLRRAERGDPG